MEYIVHHSSRLIISRLGNKDNIKLSFSNPDALSVNYHPPEGNFKGRQQVSIEISKKAMIEAAKTFLIWAENN